MHELRGACVVITGASRGIGRAADVGAPEAVLQVARRAIEGGWRSPGQRAMVTAGLAIAAGLAALLLAPRAARGAGAEGSAMRAG